MFEMIHSSQKQIKYSVPLDISSPGEREKEKIIIKKNKTQDDLIIHSKSSAHVE